MILFKVVNSKFNQIKLNKTIRVAPVYLGTKGWACDGQIKVKAFHNLGRTRFC